jgi:phage terminase Nu1 subunit (DNA packaging protein)
MVEAPSVYSVRGAARRVGRHRVTIQEWLREGMPCRRYGTHRVEIDEDVLTEWLRKKIVANPVRPGALNYKARQEGTNAPLPTFQSV